MASSIIPLYRFAGAGCFDDLNRKCGQRSRSRSADDIVNADSRGDKLPQTERNYHRRLLALTVWFYLEKFLLRQ